jgi:hypothetical protein
MKWEMLVTTQYIAIGEAPVVMAKHELDGNALVSQEYWVQVSPIQGQTTTEGRHGQDYY